MAILTSSTDLVPAPSAVPAWRRILADAVSDLDQLCGLVGISRADLIVGETAGRQFPLLVPRGYIARIERGNPRDPLLLQVLPSAAEEQARPGYVDDPVGDIAARLAPGVLQKYQGRALIVTTGACAVHCRYCFRRRFNYDELPGFAEIWDSAASAVAADCSLHEVILSGGDPLTLSDERLRRLASRMANIPHVRRLRVHTRLPILIPERVNDSLLAWLTETRLAAIVVIHANHANELDGAVAAAISRLVDSGIVVLNQSVLLRGINDDLDTLLALSERLIDLRVMPYYLHQLDRATGAAHFEVPEMQGEALIEALRKRLPGYAVPRYVRETAGEPGKSIIA